MRQLSAFIAILALLNCFNLSVVEGCGGCGSRRRSSSSASSSSSSSSYRRSRPSPRHGGWGSWSAWYSAYCSGGHKTVRRYCNNPSPAYGGSYCYGSSTKSRDCNECNDYNGGCAHSCINTYGSYRCTCYSGYRRNPYNSKKCVLITCATSNWPPPSQGKLLPQCSNQSHVNYGTTCTVTCDRGYKIDGSSSSRCTSDGSWYPRKSPNCRVKECKPLYPPKNGDIIPSICKTKPLHGQRCFYKCGKGYKVLGPFSTMCDNGNWTQGGFTCRDVEPPRFLNCPSRQTVYAQKGKTTATVSWTLVKATDNDMFPITPQPRPNVKSTQEFAEGSHTVIYTAMDQSRNKAFCYFRVNVRVLRCPVLTPPANGYLVTGRCANVYGGLCRWQCYKGYKQKGSGVNYCEKIPGRNLVRWSGGLALCEAVKCPPLHTPVNSYSRFGVRCNRRSYSTSCSFSCKRGYQMAGGSKERTCQENQKWSGTDLQCQAVTCPIIAIKSEGLVISPPICTKPSATLKYGTKCRFTCKNGYQLQGPEVKTCNHRYIYWHWYTAISHNQNSKSGYWSPSRNPSCKDVSKPTFINCPSDIIATADRSRTSTTVTWTPPTATDNSGAISKITRPGKQSGQKFPPGEHSIRYLASDNTGNVGECNFKITVSVVRCLPKLYTPAGGSKQCTEDNIYGSKCSFTCHRGYKMVGPAKRVCEKSQMSPTGYWTGQETKCELIRCPRLSASPHSVQTGCRHGATDNVFGDKCLFSCEIGHHHTGGSTQRVCQANGTWSGKAILCQAVRCDPLQDPKDGSVSPESCESSPEYGTTCRFTCRKGFRLQGKPAMLCLSDGQWSENTTVSCKDVESPSFGLTCPGDIKRFAERAKNFTTITWSKVEATDNSGVTPTVTVTGVRRMYYVGKHLIVYKARDEARNFKLCQFHVTIEVLQCPALLLPSKGSSVVGKCDISYGSTCRIRCPEGYDLLGPRNITCEAKPGDTKGYWDKPPPVCKVRTCSPLKAPKFGSIHPSLCKSLPTSGTTCYFECNHDGFLADGGVKTAFCGTDGNWNMNETSILKCRDATPPTLSCPSDIRANLRANASASVHWKIPAAFDNSNESVQITVSPPGIKPPFTFYKTTVITYTATDASGNRKECSFKVMLEDNSGPEVVYCPPDQNITPTQTLTKVTWKTPQFKDNSNGNLTIFSSRENGSQFFWGTWIVYYKAFDNNPNNKPAVCQFTIRLKPKACEELSPPKRGAVACDNWLFGSFCSPFCHNESTFPRGEISAKVWTCGPNLKWFPSPRLPDCTEPSHIRQAKAEFRVFYYEGDCRSLATQEEIKKNFIKILKESRYDFACQQSWYKDKCRAENVKVKCDIIHLEYRRLKRASVFSRSRRSSQLIPQTTITFNIVVRLDNSTGVNETKQSKVLAGLAGVGMARTIGNVIKKAVENGSLSLNVHGTVFVPDKKSVNISEPERLCDTGQVYQDELCVSCTSGTYLNKVLGICEDCPIGTYQEYESQESCLPCPQKTSTVESRTDHRSSCLAFCKAGSYSPTGLEPCISCEKGFYQDKEGQKGCFKCISATTTPGIGSTTSKECRVPCPPGSFSRTGLVPCTLCNRRSFQPHIESRACVPCPGTTVALQEGSKGLKDCQEINNCEPNPCKNNFVCTDLIDDFTCTCQLGYTGKQCETNVDDCQDQPCLNNGTCHDLVNNYTCTCPHGFQGFNCEDDVDECISSPCSNHASCSNIPGGFSCLCEPGYTGRLCDTDIDYCMLASCQNGGTCEDGANNHTCHCVTGYQGNDCEENIDECASDPCQNEATCVDGIASYHCICNSGFHGKNCEENIDDCINVECKNNATCVDQVNGFQCICPEGFTGKKCELNIDECDSNPCLNEARCIDKINGYHCECNDGFDGIHCENNIDDCASNPCSNNGTCHDGINEFACACQPGFTGNTCSWDIDHCASMPCLNNASCLEGPASYSCQCADGFSGDQCQYNIDDCQNATCLNGGTCIDGADEYACVCPGGFTGLKCEINIDECAQIPCLNGGTCTDLINDFQCICKRGYTGRTCRVDINECSSSPCHNHGTCIDKIDSYSCTCTDGFSGPDCSVNNNDCLVHACANGATCRDGINTYTCDCRPGYLGTYCETEVDECESSPCLYGGTCYDQVNAFHCDCKSGFTGQRCERNIDDCESHPCLNNGTCTDLVADYSCSCSNGFTGRGCENRIDYCSDAKCSQNGVCVNLQTGYSCRCNDGYFGKYCEFEIDECLAKPCFNNATCRDGVNNFTCSCTAGFTGRKCELNIDDCLDNACLNNATCIDHSLGYSCLCAEGYNGTYCQNDINECESNPCRNGGTCVDEIYGYKCRCLTQFTGENCEDKKDPCLSFVTSPCQNGGTCQGDISTGNTTCLCKSGYTGETCETNIDECASEPCIPNSYCIDLVNGYECKCYPSYTGDHCDIFLGSNFDLIFKHLTTKDMVVLSNVDDIPEMDSFTIAFFVRADSGYNSGTLFTYSVPGEPNDVIILSFTESKVQFTIKDEVVSVNFPLADDLWHFVGVVWNGITGYVSVYIDGPEVKKATNVLKGDILAGDGWIVLGQRYLAGGKNPGLSTAFVGTLYQVNLWNVAANPDHMWNAAHNCTWPIAGSVRAWTNFLQGIKGKVEKRFMTQCQALPMCTTNCSHFLDCESRHGYYYCNCQPGFSGPHCNMNIDECSSSPCVNGKCVDGVNRYDCICNKGYWGTNCDKEVKRESKGECLDLPVPLNGRMSCQMFSGKKVCTLTCNDGYSYNTDTTPTYDCGPDTEWRWNGLEGFNVPACSSKAAPKEIEHHFGISVDEMSPCEGSQSYNDFRSAFEREVSDTLQTIRGCPSFNTCILKEVTVPGCGWTANQRKRRAVTNSKDVLFSLSVKGYDSDSTNDDVEEKSEAILFQMQYAVSTGQFVIAVDGINSTANRSSFEHVSSDVICNPGFVKRSDRMGCVACPEGTFYQVKILKCIPCPQGSYQDDEGRLFCKRCGEGKTTRGLGSREKEDCVINSGS